MGYRRAITLDIRTILDLRKALLRRSTFCLRFVHPLPSDVHLARILHDHRPRVSPQVRHRPKRSQKDTVEPLHHRPRPAPPPVPSSPRRAPTQMLPDPLGTPISAGALRSARTGSQDHHPPLRLGQRDDRLPLDPVPRLPARHQLIEDGNGKHRRNGLLIFGGGLLFVGLSLMALIPSLI